MDPDRRLLVSARRHADRCVLREGQEARWSLGPRPAGRAVSRTRMIRDAIRAKALELGFDAVGFAKAALAPEARENLQAFIAQGLHGEMDWMPAKADRRGDPQVLWPDARTVVVLGLNYGPDEDPLEVRPAPDRADISVYARHRDYHDVLKKK